MDLTTPYTVPLWALLLLSGTVLLAVAVLGLQVAAEARGVWLTVAEALEAWLVRRRLRRLGARR